MHRVVQRCNAGYPGLLESCSTTSAWLECLGCLRPGTQSTEPVHALQAHSEAITQVRCATGNYLRCLAEALIKFFVRHLGKALLLKSSRIPEALEAGRPQHHGCPQHATASAMQDLRWKGGCRPQSRFLMCMPSWRLWASFRSDGSQASPEKARNLETKARSLAGCRQTAWKRTSAQSPSPHRPLPAWKVDRS